MAREIHDDGPAVEVADYSDLKPCPLLTTTWPARVTARCVCCERREEFFIDQRATSPEGRGGNSYTIPVEDHAPLLARAMSGASPWWCGGWLLISHPTRGIEWCCRTCARVALDFDEPVVQLAVAKQIEWSQIEVIDSDAPPPKRKGWFRR
jgi:hypothetical protein